LTTHDDTWVTPFILLKTLQAKLFDKFPQNQENKKTKKNKTLNPFKNWVDS